METRTPTLIPPSTLDVASLPAAPVPFHADPREFFGRGELLTDAALFDVCFSAAPTAVVLVGLVAPSAGVVLRANPAYAAMLGRRVEDVVGASLHELSIPEDREAEDELITSLVSGTISGFERLKSYARPDGSVVRACVNAGIIKDEQGQVFATLSVVENLTKLTESAEAVRRAEMHELLVASLPVGICQGDANGRLVFANAHWLNLAGLSLAGAMGAGWLTAVHPDDRARVSQAWDAARASSAVSETQFVFLRPDGSIATVLARLVPELSSDGQVAGWVAVVVDLSERLQAAEAQRCATEEHTRATERLLVQQRLMADGERFSHTGSWQRDSASGVGTWSVEACRIFDLDPARGAPSVDEILARVHPEDRARVAARIDVQAPRHSTSEMRYRIVRPDGEVRHIRDVTVVRERQGGCDSLAGSFQDVTEHIRAEEAAAHATRGLTTLWRGNEALVRAQTEAMLLETMCDTVVTTGGNRFVWYGRPVRDEPRTVSPVAFAGHCAGLFDDVVVSWGDGPLGAGPAGTALRTGQAQLIDDLVTDPRTEPWREASRRRGYRGVLALPVVVNGALDGVLTIYADRPGTFDTNARQLMEQLAHDLGYGIGRLRDAVSLTTAIDGVIEVVAATVEVRDPYTAGHQDRVSQLSVALARRMGLGDTVIRGIALGARIHDLGKIAVPAEILNRPGSLSEHEMALARGHSVVGYDIVKRFDFPWPIADMVRQHHERIDGSGYPDGVPTGEIRPEALIIAVADVVEAMAHHRPYRPGLGLDVALAEIARGAGHVYDAEAARACQAVFDQGFTFTA